VGTSIQHIEQLLAACTPRQKRFRRWLNRAAVAIILRERDGNTEVLMIKRAEHEGDTWSGQMAFPGGRLERTDRHGLQAACRETAEEIGLSLQAKQCIGRLSETMTHFQLRRRATVVSPYVFELKGRVTLTPNYEVAEVIWVPLAFLRDRSNREKMLLRLGRVNIPLPCYRYQGRCIWGLSLQMLDNLLDVLDRG
jgi:8-oxo-dGTP pyrophosphatase MutT (NUDIX family)